MKIKKIIISILTALVLMISIFLYMNKDKFVYVGSVDIIEVDCSKKRQILSEVLESDQRSENQMTSSNTLKKIIGIKN